MPSKSGSGGNEREARTEVGWFGVLGAPGLPLMLHAFSEMSIVASEVEAIV